MKTNMMRMFLTLGVACVCGGVMNAQTSQLGANVPFEFQVGDKVLPEGKYVVSAYGSTGSQAKLTAATGENYFIAGAYATMAEVRPGRLVFRCYGDACFLAEIWPMAGAGRAVPASRGEKLMRNNGTLEMAMRTVDLRKAD